MNRMSRVPGMRGLCSNDAGRFRVVQMIRAVFAIPGDIATRTGGYIYDRRVMDLLPGCGIDVMHLPLPGSFPHPSNAQFSSTGSTLRW